MRRCEQEKLERLRRELEILEENGISLSMDGSFCTPEEIVQAHAVAEPGCYMRDYIEGKGGEVEEVVFDYIKE